MSDEDPYEVSAFWPTVSAGLVLIFVAAVWVGPLITDSLAVQAVIAIALVMTLTASSFMLGRRGGRGAKVMAIFLAWIAMTVSFAVVYAVVCSYSPASFRAGRDLYDSSVRNDLDALLPKLGNTLTELYCVELLDAAAERVAPQLLRAGKNRRVSLTSDTTFAISQEVHRRPDSKLENPTFMVIVTLSWEEGHNTLTSMVHTYSTVEVDPRNRFVNAISDARTSNDIHDAITPYRAFLESHLAVLDREGRALLMKGISLDISHFIFMSSCISTTIGSADVTPNSAGTRYLVILQGFCSVFLFGYAANVLWT